MNELSDAEKLTKVYEFCIRMERTIEDVATIKKWWDGEGLIPGARFQLWILWAVFLAVVGKVWGK